MYTNNSLEYTGPSVNIRKTQLTSTNGKVCNEQHTFTLLPQNPIKPLHAPVYSCHTFLYMKTASKT